MGRMRGCLWLTAGLVVALLAGVVAFITISRIDGGDSGEGLVGGARVPVVVAASAIEVRAQLTTDNIEQRELPVNAVPEGAIRDLEEAIGKITLVDLYPGEVILAQRLVDPNIITGDGRYALVVAEDEVLMAFPASDLMSRTGVLKPGDRVDLLFTMDFPTSRGFSAPLQQEEQAEEGGPPAGQGSEPASFSLLQNVAVAAVVGEVASPQAYLFTLAPQDALTIKYALDAGGIQDIVLRAPGAEQPFDLEPVDIDFMINRYRIPVGTVR
jgi:pilus assembly protein CpaB